MKQQTTKSVGDLGESIVCRSLEKKGFVIVERNYRKKYGEIDVIAEREGLLYFVEVKSIRKSRKEYVGFRPEENVHPEKIRRFSKAVETYLLEKRRSTERWFFWVAVVIIDEESRNATVKYIEDVLPAR